MSSFFALSSPIFAVIALGFFCAKRSLVSPEAAAILTRFAVTIALPALLFRTIAQQPIHQIFELQFVIAFLTVSLAIYGGTVLVYRWFTQATIKNSASCGGGATISNLGFLGVPLLTGVLGAQGAAPIAIVMVVELGIVMAICISLMSAAPTKNGDVQAKNQYIVLLMGMLTNPMLVAVFMGGAVSALELTLPTFVDRFLGFLGAAASPTALFALGTMLARAITLDTLFTAFVVSLVKLLLYPLVVWYVLDVVLSMDERWVQAGVLAAALPTANSVFAVSQFHQAQPERAAAVVLLSTVLAAATFPLFAWGVAR